MPYIKQERREELHSIVKLIHQMDVRFNGDLNYILFAVCKMFVEPSYNNYKNYIGELRQCATEIERRLLAPYEDKKWEENGDI